MNALSEKEKVPYVVTSKSYTAVAINAASKAGEWIKSRLGTVSELGTKYSPQDLVTEVDKGAEQMIRRLILTHFPDHAVLGEEGVEPGPEASARALKEAKRGGVPLDCGSGGWHDELCARIPILFGFHCAGT